MEKHDINAKQLMELSHVTIEQAMDGIFWLDEKGHIYRANEAACTQLGYTRKEFLRLSIADIDVKIGVKGFQELWSRLKLDRKETFESRHKRKNGKTYPAEITSYYIKSPENDGKDYTCNFFRDITHLKQTQHELKESEERFRSTFEEAPVGIAHVTLDRKWLRVNRTLCRLTGYTRDEMEAITFRELNPPDSPEEDLLQVEKIVAGQIQTFSIEKPMMRKDGTSFWIHLSVSLKRNDTGAPDYMIAVVEDITARKQAEEELQALKNQLENENIYLQEEIRVEHNFGEIIGRCDAFKSVLRKVEQVAGTEATVLILGETGTGKELIARAVHDLSGRKKRPLVKVNCASLPANLIESELFGHEKGAFTGALARKSGRFELADGGTIFLDEIGDLPLELQAKLLRVLQEGEFERLGNPQTMKVDVRVIAATNRDLKKLMEQGLFREDLYYRLNVFPIDTPPLRERMEDIPDLVRHFIHKYKTKTASKVSKVASGEMKALQSYRWPGNIRELENIIERALIISRGESLELEEWLMQSTPQKVSGKMASLSENEKAHILKALELTAGRISGDKGAAKLLDINPKTLRSRMVKLGLLRS